MSPDTNARLAPDYPFPHPRHSYVFAEGQALAPDAVAWSREGRTAVMAYGSNRSPEVLARKFAHEPDAVLPTLIARVKDFDVAYAAMVSTLGPVPATLAPCPGATCEAAVQFLTADQLERMHQSERVDVSYGFAELPSEVVEVEGIGPCRCWFYFCLSGILRLEGAPIALAEIACEGRQWRAAPQREMQALVRRRLGSTAAAHDFLLEHIQDEAVRRDRIARLSAGAIRWRPQLVSEAF